MNEIETKQLYIDLTVYNKEIRIYTDLWNVLFYEVFKHALDSRTKLN
jgi:hypothetical protein